MLMNRVKQVMDLLAEEVHSEAVAKVFQALRVSMTSSEVVHKVNVGVILSGTFSKNLKSSSDKEALVVNKEDLVELSSKLKDKTLL